MKSRFVGLILFLLVHISLSAGTLDEAGSLENAGDISGAVVLYELWLENSGGGSGYAEVLQHAAFLYSDPLDTIELISTFIDKVPAGDTYKLYAAMAAVESSIGLLGDAAYHYSLASVKPGTAGELWRLEELTLRFQMGEYTEARIDAMALYRSAADPRVREESLALAAICLSREGSDTEALRLLDEYLDRNTVLQSPLPLFAMREIASFAGNPDMARKAEDSLVDDFPGSAARYLVEARVLEWISPAAFIEGYGSIPGNSVQVGAFGSRERSASLRTRLEYDGFTAWIEQHDEVWKVFVNDSDGTVIDRLSAAGYGSLF